MGEPKAISSFQEHIMVSSISSSFVPEYTVNITMVPTVTRKLIAVENCNWRTEDILHVKNKELGVSLQTSKLPKNFITPFCLSP